MRVIVTGRAAYQVEVDQVASLLRKQRFRTVPELLVPQVGGVVLVTGRREGAPPVQVTLCIAQALRHSVPIHILWIDGVWPERVARAVGATLHADVKSLLQTLNMERTPCMRGVVWRRRGAPLRVP